MLRHWDSYLKRWYPQARKVRAEMFYGWIEELVHLRPFDQPSLVDRKPLFRLAIGMPSVSLTEGMV